MATMTGRKSARVHLRRGDMAFCGQDPAYWLICLTPDAAEVTCGSCLREMSRRCGSCGYLKTKCDCEAVALAGGRRELVTA